MLQSLHVKNLALIEETEISFGPGLNILTGETGAGKSLLLGAIQLALGGKFEKEMLRKGSDSALVELLFAEDGSPVRQKLAELELEPGEDGCVILTRKISPGKSVYRVNGETVTARQVKELAELLLDIHGQHEHQSLLHKKKHMEILDDYGGEPAEILLAQVQRDFRARRELEQRIAEETRDEAALARERSLAEFEWREIEEARLKPGEDEELEREYRRMSNIRRIRESMAESYRYTGGDSENGAGGALDRGLRALRSVTAYDERLQALESQLAEVDNLLADYNREVSDYLASECGYEEEELHRVEERLNTLNRLKSKYGGSIAAVLSYGEERQSLLDKLADYDTYMGQLKGQLDEAGRALEQSSAELSGLRRKNGEILCGKLTEAMRALNFLTVDFEIAVRPKQEFTAKGYDDVEFLISTNPGEPRKPLSQVASGGELSRIMLAIKTVLAGRDDIDTLIFDEIDAGISGKTAWRVSEQLDTVARAHQVICITHLPQIAAMADIHFVIEKSSTEDNTITDIRLAEEEESVRELARLLGSDDPGEAALSNAKEMRKQALRHKQEK